MKSTKANQDAPSPGRCCVWHAHWLSLHLPLSDRTSMRPLGEGGSSISWCLMPSCFLPAVQGPPWVAPSYAGGRCAILPSPAFSDITLGAWDQSWWECLHHENRWGYKQGLSGNWWLNTHCWWCPWQACHTLCSRSIRWLFSPPKQIWSMPSWSVIELCISLSGGKD